MAEQEKYNIRTEWDMDHCCWEYHVYSSRTGFVLTCQTLRQANLFIDMCKRGN